ncbi:pilus assembly protein TadG-related protein [Brachybacterium sp. DNPG3]
MTVLTTGVLVVIIMVMAVGTAVTGVHLERSALQDMADSAALAGADAMAPSRLYDGVRGPLVDESSARTAAQAQLARQAGTASRSREVAISRVEVDADGTVRVVVTARVDPPLAGWFTRGTGTAVPVAVEGEARAR